MPYVRGRELSRDETEILDEVRRLDSEGVREITLIGQNVNSYRGESDFPQLLRHIESEVTGIKWIRFMSSHPKDLSDDLIENNCGIETSLQSYSPSGAARFDRRSKGYEPGIQP